VCCAVLCALPDPAHAEPQAAPDGGPGFEAQGAEADTDVIKYADGRLTIDVVEVPLPTVLREIGKQTGARVEAQGLDTVQVTDEFTKMPLDAAVRRLVAGRNYTLIYGKVTGSDGKVTGRRLKDLQVFGGASTDRHVVPAIAPARASAGKQPAAAAVEAQAQPAEPRPAATAAAAPRRAEPAADPEASAERPPRRAPLANPVSAAIVGDEIEPDPADEAGEDEPWVQGYDQDAPMYEDDGFAAEVDADNEAYDAGVYGDQLEEMGYDDSYDDR
jgi:hypothetical protein